MEKKEFIKQWMKTYDPDTFKQSNNGRYFYRSEDLSSGIDLECFFEELLIDFESAMAKESEQQSNCNLPVVSGSLPSVDEAGVMAVKISEMVEPPLTAQEQSFFIAGFCECVKWLGSNDR